jgi:uncharacterized repeat protein (TIGR03803 family)
MLRKISFRKRSAMLVLLAFGLLLGAAWAQTESVLYSFCSQDNCTDGASPYAGVVFDQKGNLYGTAAGGGTGTHEQAGVVFKLTPKGKETVLYNFCEQEGCTDGAGPEAGVVFDQKGNMYGTTFGGGIGDDPGYGVVFKLTPQGKYTVLHTFEGADGANPAAGLVFDQKGNMYGTTVNGGANGGGAVFKLTPKGKETVLYSFCAQSNCADGEWPYAGVALDRKGNLYGTTYAGGAYDHCGAPVSDGCGVVFELTPEGKETVLYSFCAQNNCADGVSPWAGLIFDQKGNLYGTTWLGGNNNPCDTGGEGCGVVFKLTPEGKETVLYNFCAQDNCVDGSAPRAGLVFGKRGDLYGTTQLGGAPSFFGGVVFKLTPEGKEKVLYSFCSQDNCLDGAQPYAGLVCDHEGNLYGTTLDGGAGIYAGGVVFKLTK